MRAIGLMNPENAQKSAGPFKEGFVRIDHNYFAVHKTDQDPAPSTKWIWDVTRLKEDGETPLTDEHDNNITESLFFGFGGKSLPFIHPGKASGPDDSDPDDLGTEIGIAGNTVFLTEEARDWKPNEKSGVMVLSQSLAKLGVKAEYLDRCWAPDWNGCTLEMKSQAGEKAADGRSFSYKIASKMLVYPGAGKKQPKGLSAVNGSGKPVDAQSILVPILAALAEEFDGQQVTRKTLNNRVRVALEAKNLDAALYLPVLKLAKDDAWMAKMADTIGYTLDTVSNSLYFGSALPAV